MPFDIKIIFMNMFIFFFPPLFSIFLINFLFGSIFYDCHLAFLSWSALLFFAYLFWLVAAIPWLCKVIYPCQHVIRYPLLVFVFLSLGVDVLQDVIDMVKGYI